MISRFLPNVETGTEHPLLCIFLNFIYLFMRDTQRESETQAEGETGSMQGARRGTLSQDSRIRPWG